jgi:hypothetical protein
VKRLLLVLLVIGAGYWLWTHSSGRSASSDAPAASPVDRARTAAARSDANAAGTDAAQRAADAPAPSGAISENMTPDQVRALLGAPDDTSRETAEGKTTERWIYRRVNKTVVFENGVVVRVE